MSLARSFYRCRLISQAMQMESVLQSRAERWLERFKRSLIETDVQAISLVSRVVQYWISGMVCVVANLVWMVIYS